MDGGFGEGETVKEKPILFSGPMVRAILADLKTHTRRAVQHQFKYGGAVKFNGEVMTFSEKNPYTGEHVRMHAFSCPYGVPGDRLWVRETFMFAKGADIRESFVGSNYEGALGEPPHYWFRATNPEKAGEPKMFKWRPAIFMPRHASRITLEILNVRVERLQQITESDAIKEGFSGVKHVPEVGGWLDSPSLQFSQLWEKLNGNKRGYGWDKNPWVWVIEFKRV